jgi:hypothetical protein
VGGGAKRLRESWITELGNERITDNGIKETIILDNGMKE